MTFAPEDAVRVSVVYEGRVQVRIALAELREGRHRWRDFAVVTHYRPDTSTLDIHFPSATGSSFWRAKASRGGLRLPCGPSSARCCRPSAGGDCFRPSSLPIRGSMMLQSRSSRSTKVGSVWPMLPGQRPARSLASFSKRKSCPAPSLPEFSFLRVSARAAAAPLPHVFRQDRLSTGRLPEPAAN